MMNREEQEKRFDALWQPAVDLYEADIKLAELMELAEANRLHEHGARITMHDDKRQRVAFVRDDGGREIAHVVWSHDKYIVRAIRGEPPTAAEALSLCDRLVKEARRT